MRFFLIAVASLLSPMWASSVPSIHSFTIQWDSAALQGIRDAREKHGDSLSPVFLRILVVRTGGPGF